MIASRGGRTDPCATPSSAPHAELLHFPFGEDFDLDAELFQLLRLGREFDGAENIGRFIDEVAGDEDAFGDRLRMGGRLLGGDRRTGDDRHLHRLGRGFLVVIVLLGGFVGVEAIGIHLHAKGEICSRLAGHVQAGCIEENRDLVGAANLGCRCPAGLQPVMRRQIGGVADAEYEDAIDGCALRRDDIESAQGFCLELGDSRGLGNDGLGIGFRSAGRLFSVKSLEQDGQATRQAC